MAVGENETYILQYDSCCVAQLTPTLSPPSLHLSPVFGTRPKLELVQFYRSIYPIVLPLSQDSMRRFTTDRHPLKIILASKTVQFIISLTFPPQIHVCFPPLASTRRLLDWTAVFVASRHGTIPQDPHAPLMDLVPNDDSCAHNCEAWLAQKPFVPPCPQRLRKIWWSKETPFSISKRYKLTGTSTSLQWEKLFLSPAQSTWTLSD